MVIGEENEIDKPSSNSGLGSQRFPFRVNAPGKDAKPSLRTTDNIVSERLDRTTNF